MPELGQASLPLNVLIIEDSMDDTILLVAALKLAGFDPEWKKVETEPEYLAHLGPNLDLIFSDYALPQFSTPRALVLLQASKLEIPFIIVSGTIGEARAVESMKAGATDYILKDLLVNQVNRLGPIVLRALQEAKERAERKRFEAQSIQSQKMEMIGHLASGIAHDFNNILGVIIGHGDLILDEMNLDSSLREHAEEIRDAAERAAGLTRQLLSFSRKQALQPVVLDLNVVLRGMDKMLRRLIDRSIELTFIFEEQIGCFKADPGQIGQVLMNLVVNARDAMPHGGKLTIETRNFVVKEDHARRKADPPAGNYVMLSVCDTGTGMSGEVKDCLFEPFFTTKPEGKGTGLGLATSQTILKQCGGHSEVQTELGKGSTFKIFFPCVEQPLEELVQPAEPMISPRGTETLLLIEDEPAVSHLCRNVLEAQGYRVMNANSCDEGLQVARQNSGQRLQLVISDVVLPQLGGLATVEWLKTAYPGSKLLFTSAYIDETIVNCGLLETGIGFLPKPYTPAALLRKVRDLLVGDAPI